MFAVRAVGADDERRIFGNQYAQVGELVDMWTHLFEGLSGKSDEFWKAYNKAKNTRSLPGVSEYDSLQATGINAPARSMEFNRSRTVTVTVYLARQGGDLYVSWRAFVQAPISLFKIILLLLAAVLFSLLNSGAYIMPFNSNTINLYYVNTEQFLTNLVASSLVLLGVFFALGFFNRKGDIWGMLRQPIYELYFDELSAMSMAIHRSLIDAADSLGVQTANIEPHEPFYERRRRPRI